ncbi:hypothetical protein EV421DRAFT_1914916 [Armillaria borealis]|uniref:Uncharacterized protein n=1 Tax=Armillaria borealis TaxID=47425 RepID=A0AA39ICI0_9AGAR|nr:hypothetical protein EV421DRAFT_1914916 [Armillaria borealis]
MKFIASLVIIALAAISSVAAEGCFSGGQPGSCDDAAYLFCKEMLTINGGQVSTITSPLSYCRNTDTESSSVAASDANAAMTPRGDIM